MSWQLLCESLVIFLYTIFGVIGMVGIIASITVPSLEIGLVVPPLAFVAIFCTKLIMKRCGKANRESSEVQPKLYAGDEKVNDYTGNPSVPFIETNEDGYIVMMPSQLDGSVFQPQTNFPLRDLDFGHTIGEGVFGIVALAKARNLARPGGTTQVAVKMLKNNHTDSEAKDLKREFEIMQSMGCHKNIVNLLGCSYDAKNKLMIIMDYAFYGNLRNYLHTHDAVSQGDLTNFALQVACGMWHLASKQCVHRDLAARNVLVTGDLTMKISDFGLARDIQEDGFYANNSRRTLAPFKWMAPEYLTYNAFGTKSDVFSWSFGVVLWELFSRADDPYPNVNVTKLKQMLENGERLAKPKNCPAFAYKLMVNCWNYVAAHRPNFDEIVASLHESIK